MKEKIKKADFFSFIWVLIGTGLFVAGIMERDWLLLVAGFLWNFDDIEIIHWHGKKYE